MNRRKKITRRTALARLAGTAATVLPAKAASQQRKVYIVPNFHPASCGWLTTFSKERVYCANSYLNHLDRVRDDPNYAFVMSEVNNIIAIMNFQPQRFPNCGAMCRRNGSSWSMPIFWSLLSTSPEAKRLPD